jgi:hypothetical protein
MVTSATRAAGSIELRTPIDGRVIVTLYTFDIMFSTLFILKLKNGGFFSP